MTSNLEFQQPISGTITASGQTIDLTSPNGSTQTVGITGTWVGVLVVEGSNDGTNYYSCTILNKSTDLVVNTITANGGYDANTNAFEYFRIRAISWTSGTATIAVYGSDATSLIFTESAIKGGTDGTTIGNTGTRLNTSSNITDGTDTTLVTTAGDLHTSDGLSNGGLQGAITLTTGGTTYEAKVGASRLTNRKNLTITALDDMFWGYSNTVTTASGSPLYKNQVIIFDINPDSTFQVWLVASGNGKTARITESL